VSELKQPPVEAPEYLAPRSAERLAAELAATRQRLQTALATARMAYWDWDPATDRLVVSRSMDDLFGLTDGQGYSSSERAFDVLHPEDRTRHRELMLRSAARGEGWHVEYRIVRPRDGAVVWLEERATVTDDGSGHARFVTGFVWDISERKHIEQLLAGIRRRAEDERESKLRHERHRREAAEAFMAVMSHELRTPVTSIRGSAALLARNVARPDAGELLEDIQDETDRLMRIIDDLMVLSGVDRGLLQLTPEPILLQHLVPTLVADLERRFPDVAFDVALPPNLSAVMADTTALRQVIHNLLTNAAKYAGPYGPVMLRARDVGEQVEVAVLDSGPGLGHDPAVLFDLFYRDPDVAGHTSGTGIGLYVVRELIRAMGTTIHAASRDGGGAEFRFRVPAVTDTEA
jgi:PAS domain S-box-containing protein